MNVENRQTITVDLRQNTLVPLPRFIQYDTNILEFIVKDNGENVDFSNIGDIVVNFKRPDRKVISRILTASGSIVEYKIGNEEMHVDGDAELEIQFFNSDNTKRISTKRMKVQIIESIGADDVYTDDESYSTLQQLLVEVRDLEATVEQNEQERIDNENARIAAENSRVNAENTRESNEATREFNETNRVAAENDRDNAESTRESNEQTREFNETNRIAAENTRESNEQARIDNENTRQTNEQTRQDNETVREQNETQRQQIYNQYDSLMNNTQYIEEWNSISTYSKNNIVSYQGSSFISLVDNNTNNIPDPSQDTAYWGRMSLAGDMSKAQYDTDNNGQVDKADDSDKLGGQLPSYYATQSQVDDHETRITNTENELTNSSQTTPLTEPVSVLNSDRVTSAKIATLEGRTVVNHVPLFNSGLWTFHANVTVDSPSKVTLNADGAWQTSSVSISVKGSTTYTLKANMSYINNVYDRQIAIKEYDNTNTLLATHYYNDTEYKTFTTNSSTVKLKLEIKNTDTSPSGTFTFEDVMLNEGSSAKEFVKDVRPIKNPILFSKGKNLLPPFSQWELDDNAKVISPYELEMTPDGTSNTSDYYVKVKPNTTYVISSITTGEANIVVRKSDDSVTYLDFTNGGIFTTDASTTEIYVRVFIISSATQTSRVKDIQLELGSTATSFEPFNQSYQVIKSSFFQGDKLYFDENGQPRKIKKNEELDLTGELDWSFNLDFAGYKMVRIVDFVLNDSVINDSEIIIKDSGKLLKRNTSVINADEMWLDVSSGNLHINISDTDSGWTDAMTPTADMIKAYFNGWKYTGDGTNHSWENMYDNTDTTTDVNVCLSRNTHTENGKDGYRLVYELAQAEDMAVGYEGSLELHEGLNQIEIYENYDAETDSIGESYLSAKVQSVEITYAKNLNTAVNENTNKITDLSYKFSVLTETKANKHQQQFIEPFLMNAYTQISGGQIGYYKDDFGIVHIVLDVTGGSGAITILPVEYRPKYDVTRIIEYNGSAGIVTVNKNGEVISNNGSLDHHIYITYRGGQ